MIDMNFSDFFKEYITEGRNRPIIVVDVQPEYANFSSSNENTCEKIIHFVCNSLGKVLMFVNAEADGLTGDTIKTIKEYWEEVYGDYIDWNRFEIVDKGYGYFRGWMDNGISDRTIIKLIRKMYSDGVSDIRELFDGEDDEDYEEKLNEFISPDSIDYVEMFAVQWTSVKRLKEYNKSYLVGGGRNECLKEVTLLMNAFNIRYRLIDELVY